MNVMRKNADWKARRKARGKPMLFDYSPEQPRDDHGRWTATGDMVVFHGTAEMFLHSIQQKGLLIKPKHRTFDKNHYRSGTPRNKSVYVSRTMMEAMRWAEHAQNAIYDDIARRPGIAGWPGRAKEAWAGLQHMTHPVILEIHIPKEEAAKLIPDKLVKNGTAQLFPDNIPPQWIKNAFVSDQEKAWGFNTRDWIKHHINDGEPADVYYAVVFIGPSVNDAGFDPAQERDENGRWTDTGKVDRPALIAKRKAIMEEMRPLAEKGTMSGSEAKRFMELGNQMGEIMFDLVTTKPFTGEKIKPEAERMSTLPKDIVMTAHADTFGNREVFMALSNAAFGTQNNAHTDVDRLFLEKPDKFYNRFNATRAALRAKFGDTMKLYRSEGKQMDKPTKNWATTREYAAQFGANIIERDVPIDEILAVNVDPVGNYHEVIVAKRPITKDAGFDESQPRDDHGRWTEGGASWSDTIKKIGETQRGRPELAMVSAQGVLGGGVLSYAIEHTGDLTHRMTEFGDAPEFFYGHEFVEPKVRRVLRMLRQAYGFEREFNENVAANHPYAAKDITLEEYKAKIDKALQAYAEEHKKIPVYNDAQRHARDAAIALGEKRFWKAHNHLTELEKHLDTREEWAAYAGKRTFDPVVTEDAGFDPSQKRDDNGRWTEGSSSSSYDWKAERRKKYEQALETQRKAEGIMAAVMDPSTGRIEVDWSHSEALDKFDADAQERIIGATDAKGLYTLTGPHIGFMKNGQFITREELEKLLGNGINTSEGVQSAQYTSSSIVRQFYQNDADPDPSGTLPLQKQFKKDMRRRWQDVKRAIREGLATYDFTGVGDRVVPFQNWIDQVMASRVLGTGAWMKGYITKAAWLAEKRAQGLVGLTKDAAPVDYMKTLQDHAVAELQGIMEAVSQQASRALANGILARKNPTNDILSLITKIGEARSNMLIAHSIMKTFSVATLETFRAQGVAQVGIIPEKVPHVHIGDAARKTVQPRGKGGKFRKYTKISRENKRKAEKQYLTLRELGTVNVMTAEDDRVCDTCESIADNGPYGIDRALSLIPAHINCRCVFIPTGRLPMEDYDPDQPRDERGRFASWFAGSKVVDEHGKPLTVYRGTLDDRGERGSRDGMIYFSRHAKVAAGAERGFIPPEDLEAVGIDPATVPVPEGLRVYPANLSIKNPASDADLKRLAPNASTMREALVAARAAGFDGYMSDYEYVVFAPSQIRSTITHDYDPDQPRAPKGSENGGQWVSSIEAEGAGEAGGGITENPKYHQPDQRVFEVGGDHWNKTKATQLELEYVAAKPALEEIEKNAVGNSVTMKGDTGEWETLGEGLQTSTEEKWKTNTYQEVYDSEVTNWHDNGDSARDAAFKVAQDLDDDAENEWLDQAIRDTYEINDDGEEVSPYPFKTGEIMAALKVDINDNGSATFDFDNDVLDDFGKRFMDPDQLSLPGMDLGYPSDRLTGAMRRELITSISEKFDERIQEVAQDMEPPEWLADSANETLDMLWSDMSDQDKYAYYKDYLGGDEEAVADFEIDEIPNTYNPTQDPGKGDYEATQKMARYMSLERGRDLIKERLGEDIDMQEAYDIDTSLWKAWVDSSTSNLGVVIQSAIADEFEARFRDDHFREKIGLKGDETPQDYAQRIARQHFGDNGYAKVRAMLRAKWETTQFMLDKADMPTVNLYRGVNLKNEAVEATTKQEITVNDPKYGEGKFTKLPDVHVQRNGAASTTHNIDVANNWKSLQDSKVTLRAIVPRTAIISVPAYGVNIHKERESVVMGTAWVGWDAWLGSAPTLENVPLKEHNPQ